MCGRNPGVILCLLIFSLLLALLLNTSRSLLLLRIIAWSLQYINSYNVPVVIAGQCPDYSVTIGTGLNPDDAGLRLLTTGRNADAVLTFLRHLLMIFQYHIARITPSAAVYGRAGVSLSTTCSLDVHWVPFSPCSMNIYIYIIILCDHFMLSFIRCYHFCYHLILSFGVIIYFLFEPINKDFWYVYPNIVTKLSKYGLGSWGRGSGI